MQSLTTIGCGDIFKELPLIACSVDPRFKRCKFLTAEKHIEIKAALTGLVCQVKELGNNQKDQSQAESSPCSSSQKQSKQHSGLSILLGDEYTSNGDSADESDPVLDEVDSYLQDKPLDREESPLLWWKLNKHRFPLIPKVAKRYLTVPVTSTPAERVFHSWFTVTRLRSCLTPDHINMLVFLNKNAFYTV